MALNATQFQSWLEDQSAIRCLLVVAQYYDGSTEQTVYYSNKNYVSDTTGKSGEIPANTFFNPIITVGLEYTENINLDGSASISFGDLSIDNTQGTNDSLLNYVWANRPIKVYIGDPLKHSTDDFTKIYSGYVSDIGSKDYNSINLRIRDAMQRFNTPISETTLGSLSNTLASTIIPGYNYSFSTSKDKDVLLPLIFGEVFNITPLLIDPTNLVYMVSNSAIESIIEVRDNGVPLVEGTNYTVDLTRGILSFNYMPAGNITCSVQGIKIAGSYSNNIPNTIKYILKTYGTAPAVDADLDLATFSTYASSDTQPFGIYLDNKANILEVCQQLASSIGMQLVSTRTGIFTLVRLTIPTLGATNINDDDILENTLSIQDKLEVIAGIKLGYAKNWTVQEALDTGIPPEHKADLAAEWYVSKQSDSSVKTIYKLSTEPEQIDTLLISNSSSQVDTEATRRLNLRKVPRFTYSMECTPKAITLQLGQMITLQYYRFGMSSGVAAQVISISTNWDSGITQVGVFV